MRTQQIVRPEPDCKRHDDPEASIFASWVRVIEDAPTQNRLVLFGMMAADACACADATRQQLIDDLLEVAGEMGLVDLIGIVAVRDTLMVAFDRGAA
jgi:hypothetical protein